MRVIDPIPCAIMTYLYACQNFSIKCQLFTLIWLNSRMCSNLSKLHHVHFIDHYIVWNQLAPFLGSTKILIFPTCALLWSIKWSIFFRDVKLKDFTCNTLLNEVNTVNVFISMCFKCHDFLCWYLSGCF